MAHGLVATADVEQVEPAFGTVVCDGVGEFFVLLGGNREELVQCVDILLDELVHANPVEFRGLCGRRILRRGTFFPHGDRCHDCGVERHVFKAEVGDVIAQGGLLWRGLSRWRLRVSVAGVLERTAGRNAARR